MILCFGMIDLIRLCFLIRDCATKLYMINTRYESGYITFEEMKFYTKTLSRLPFTRKKKTHKRQTCIRRFLEEEISNNKLGNTAIH